MSGQTCLPPPRYRPPGLVFSSCAPESVKRIIFVRGLVKWPPELGTFKKEGYIQWRNDDWKF